jgi:hypothetical protein
MWMYSSPNLVFFTLFPSDFTHIYITLNLSLISFFLLCYETLVHIPNILNKILSLVLTLDYSFFYKKLTYVLFKVAVRTTK